MSDAAFILRRHAQLKGARAACEQSTREVFLYLDPARAEGWNTGSMTPDQVAQQRSLLTDSTAADAQQILASSVMAGCTPANAQWFEYDLGNETDEERKWLSGSAELSWENIHNANFDAEGYEGVLDLTGAGWMVLFIDEDKDRGGLAFMQFPLAQCYLASTRPDGRADTLYREYDLTAEQALKEFEGGHGVSAKVAKLAKEKPDTLVRFVHAIYPRQTSVVNARLSKNLPFASCIVEVDGKHMVRESGFHECPFVAPRWQKSVASSAYGSGQAHKALPDIRTLNALVRNELAAASLSVAGMWIAEDDGVLNPRTVRVGPGKIITANSVDSMKPLLTGGDFNVSFSIKADLQRAIRKTMMADQLQPQDGPAMTATEVHVRVNMIRQLLGPVYGRLQAEWLSPMIERCFGLMFRAGVFAPPPESMVGRELSVRYTSPMARAQKLEDVTAMDRFEVSMGQSAAALSQVDPAAAAAIYDNYDMDMAARKKGELLGVPAELLRDVKDITKIRAERAAAAQQAQQQAVLQQGLAAAADAGGKSVAGAAVG